jgi:hypothetical protein
MAILLLMKNIFRIFFEGFKPQKDPHRPSPVVLVMIWAGKPSPCGPKIADSQRKVSVSEHYLYEVIIIFDFFVTLCTSGEGRKAATFTSER